MGITDILNTGEGVVRVFWDYSTDTYSIGLRTTNKMEIKYISRELYLLLVKELPHKVGIK